MIERIKSLFGGKSVFDIVLICFANAAFAIIILFGAYITVKMNRGGKSLWFDEMALVESITNRGMGELLSRGLDNCQSAPALWLYLVKIIISLFGNNEFNLRLLSVLSYIGTVIGACILGKRVFKSSLPLGYGAFTALIGFFVRYSVVCKPYESDALCVLIVILTFFLFITKRINYIALSIIWAILIWVSNPVCFFEGGLILAYLIPHAIIREWKDVSIYIQIGIFIVISFVANYIVWLRQSVGYMQDYWEGSQWPFIITSGQDIDDLRKCTDIVFGVYDKAKYIIIILFVVGLIVSVIKRQQLIIGIYIGCLITCFASYIGFFPVSDRLWCFSYPLIAILAIYALSQIIDYFIKNKTVNNIVFLCLLSLLICTQTGWKYLYTYNLWWQHEEINAELDYLESVITDEDNIYIYCNALRGYAYKYRDGEVMEVVTSTRSDDDVEGTVDDIASLNNCYIVTTHYAYMDENDDLTKVFHGLEELGYVQLVYYDHQTALVYYCTDEDNKKIEVNPEDYWY